MRGVHARARVHRPLRVRRMVQYEDGGACAARTTDMAQMLQRTHTHTHRRRYKEEKR